MPTVPHLAYPPTFPAWWAWAVVVLGAGLVAEYGLMLWICARDARAERDA